MENQSVSQEPEYLRVHQVAKLFGVAVATVWLMARDGRLPKSIHLGKKTTVWSRQEIERHIRNIDIAAIPSASEVRGPSRPQHPNVVAGTNTFWAEVRAGLRKHPRESDESFAERKRNLAAAEPLAA